MGHPSAAEDSAEIARLRLSVVRLARQIRQHGQSGVTPSQLSALATLNRHGPMPLGGLAEHERIGRSTVTRLVRGLEEAGFVERAPDPADGRSAIVSATPVATRLLEESRRRSESFLATRVARLSPEERALLTRVSDTLERLGEPS
jgi:DNA-binding MarR family transcriptional regulator